MTKYTYTFSDGSSHERITLLDVTNFRMTPHVWKADGVIGIFKTGVRLVIIEMEHVESK